MAAPSSSASSSLSSVLGKVFTRAGSYSSPNVVQVMGWTKGSERPDAKRRYAFVRKVKFLCTHGPSGGNGKICQTDILKVTTPIYSISGSGLERMMLHLPSPGPSPDSDFEDEPTLSIGGDYYMLETDLDRNYMWCEY
jgi:hypothetical protein